MDNSEVIALLTIAEKAGGFQLGNILTVAGKRLMEINAECGEALKAEKAEADAKAIEAAHTAAVKEPSTAEAPVADDNAPSAADATKTARRA